VLIGYIDDLTICFLYYLITIIKALHLIKEKDTIMCHYRKMFILRLVKNSFNKAVHRPALPPIVQVGLPLILTLKS